MNPLAAKEIVATGFKMLVKPSLTSRAEPEPEPEVIVVQEKRPVVCSHWRASLVAELQSVRPAPEKDEKEAEPLLVMLLEMVKLVIDAELVTFSTSVVKESL